MEVEYRRDLGHNYVVLESRDQADTASYQVRMMLSNKIEGLLECSIRGIDGRSMFCYEITSRQSLKSLFEHGSPGRGEIVRLYEEVFAVLERIQRFLLNMDSLVLDPELIFFTPGREKVNFCFFPGYEKDIRQSLRELMEYLLPKIDHQDPEAVMAGYGLYRKVMEENCDLEEMRSVLFSGEQNEETMNTGKTEKKTISSGGNSGKFSGDEAEESADRERQRILDEFFEEEEEEEPFWKRYMGIAVVAALLLILILIKWLAMPGWFYLVIVLLTLAGGAVYGVYRIFTRGKSGWEERIPVHRPERGRASPGFFQFETSSFFDEGEQKIPKYEETEILTGTGEGGGEYHARLEGTGTAGAEMIVLDKEITLLGKMSGTVDVVLKSSAVSRIHARILLDGGKCCLEDLSSRNGTFVNGQAVSMGDAVVLKDGDEVRFGDLTYLFRTFL